MTFSQQRRRSLAAVVAASALMLGTITTAHAAPSRSITWEDCPETTNEAGVSCGRIDVPMDYSNPEGKSISIGLVKLPATGKRKGTLFMNPGGPGVPVYNLFDTNSLSYYQWPEEIRKEWDVVAVQPRGLEGSTPLECKAPELTPDKVTNLGGALLEECEKTNPGYAQHVNTENTAHDWDEVRQALGEEKISLVGRSYGTFLASQYATIFPEHTDKVVLDAGYNPKSPLDKEQLRGFDEAYTDFFTWVSQHDDTYHMGTTPKAVYEKWAARVKEESGALPTVAPPNATDKERAETKQKALESQVASGGNQAASPSSMYVALALPWVKYWPMVAKAISSPEPTTLPAEAQAQTGESSAMDTVVLCNDQKRDVNPRYAAQAAWAQVTGDPYYRAYLGASGLNCAGIEPTNPAGDITGAKLKTKPLQIQGTRDPNTPYWNFQDMADAMQSHVLTVEGAGHVQMLTNNPKLDKIIAEYLRTGKAEETKIKGVEPKPQ